MADQNFTIGADASGMEGPLKRIEDAFEKQTKVITDYVSKLLESNKVSLDQEKLMGTLAKSIDLQAQSLQQLADISGKLINLTKQLTNAEEEAAASVKESNLEKEAAIAKQERLNRILEIGNKLSARSANQEVAPIERARATIPVGRIRNILEAAPEDFQLGRVDEILEDLEKGVIKSFTGIDQKIATTLRQLLLAEKAFGRLSTAAKIDPQIKAQEASQINKDLTEKFVKPLADLNIPTNKLDLLISTINRLIDRSNIAASRVRDIATAAETPGGLQQLNLTDRENQLARALQQLQTLKNKGLQAGEAVEAGQVKYNLRLKEAQPILQGLINQLGGLGKIDTARGLNQLQARFVQLNKLIGENKVTIKEIQDLFNNLNTNKGKITQLVSQPDQAKAQKLLSDIITQFNAVGAAAEDAGERGKKGSGSILLSWQSVFRILEGQVIGRVLFGFIANMEQAVSEATKFQQKISELRTLSQESQLSTGAFADELIRLSNSFNLPLLDVVGAEYEILSNQVGEGVQTFQFLNTSLQFSKITLASAKDGANLLSAAVQAFSSQNVSAERAANVLFKTIDLGRVTASEMADTFGRVGTVANALGVTIEELSASIATITVQGTKYNEAYTLINNVLLKLLRPSEAMKNLFKSWGVENGQAAIQTFGFVGVLRLLDKELESGGLTKIAELEQDMRAIRGAVALTGDAFGNFEQNLKKIGDGAKDAERAAAIIKESPAFKFEQELNKVKNFFTTEVGSQLINSILRVTEPLGGIAKVTKDFVSIGLQFIRTLTNIAEIITKVTGFFTQYGPSLKTITVLTISYIGVLTAARAAIAGYIAVQTLERAEVVKNIGTKAAQVAGYLGLNPIIALNTAQQKSNSAAVAENIVAREVQNASLGSSSAFFNMVNNQMSASNAGLQSISAITPVAAANTGKFAQALALVSSPAALATGGLAILTLGLNEYIRSSQEASDVSETFARKIKDVEAAASEDRVKQAQLTADEQTKGILDTFDQSFRGFLQFTANVRKEINKLLDDSLTTTSIVAATTNEQFQDVLKDVENQLKTISSIQKQVEKEISASRKNIQNIQDKENQRQFEESLVDTNAEERLRLTLNLVQDIRSQSVDLFNAGKIDEARSKLEQVGSVLQKIQQEQKKIFDESKKLEAQIREKESLRQFEESLIDTTAEARLILTLNYVRQIRSESVDLFNAGNVDAARSKLEQVSKVLEKILQEQKKIFEESKKVTDQINQQTDLRNFERSLIGKTTEQQLQLILNRVEDIKFEAQLMFDAGDIDRARKGFEEINKTLEDTFKNQQKILEESKKQQLDIESKAELRGFERSLIGKNSIQQSKLTLDRINQLKREAVDLFNNDNLEGARKKFEEIERLAEKLFEKQKAFREKSQKLGVRFETPLVGRGADELLNQNTRDRLVIEDLIQKRSVKNLQTLDERIKANTSDRLTNENTLQAETLRNITEINNQLKVNVQERIGLEKAVQEQALKNLKEVNDQIKNNVKERIGLETEYQRIQQERLALAIAAETKLQEVSEKVNKALEIRKKLEKEATTGLQGRANAVKEQEAIVKQLETEFADIQKSFTAARNLDPIISPLQGTFGAGVVEIQSRAALKRFNEAFEAFKQNKTEATLTELVDAYSKIVEPLLKINDILAGSNDTKSVQGTLAQVDTITKALTAARQSLVNGQENEKRLTNLQNLVGPLFKELDAFKAVNVEVEKAAVTTEQINQKNVKAVQELVGLMERVKNIAKEINELGGLKIQIPGAQQGQIPRRAFGGPVGTDTQLVWATPGEFFMNAAASRRFYPQLVAMNSGVQPQYRANGGTVNNIGDLIVNVNGGGTSQSTVREIGEQLRREIRRGTLRLS